MIGSLLLLLCFFAICVIKGFPVTWAVNGFDHHFFAGSAYEPTLSVASNPLSYYCCCDPVIMIESCPRRGRRRQPQEAAEQQQQQAAPLARRTRSAARSAPAEAEPAAAPRPTRKRGAALMDCSNILQEEAQPAAMLQLKKHQLSQLSKVSQPQVAAAEPPPEGESCCEQQPATASCGRQTEAPARDDDSQQASAVDNPAAEPVDEKLSAEAAAAAAECREFDPCSKTHVTLVHAALHADMPSSSSDSPKRSGPSSSASSSSSSAPHGRQQQFTQLHGILHKANQAGVGRCAHTCSSVSHA